MKKIDDYSYQCGVMDCFNEMVRAGLKRVALAHPSPTKALRDQYIPFAEQITQKYGTHYYLDDTPLLTDLFPYSLNKDTYNLIFYKNVEDIEEYKLLKELKTSAIQKGEYQACRMEIASRFGRLLGYGDETIKKYIDCNEEKEKL